MFKGTVSGLPGSCLGFILGDLVSQTPKQKSWYLSGMSLRLPHEKKQPKTVRNSSLVGIHSTKSEDRVSFFLLQKKKTFLFKE